MSRNVIAEDGHVAAVLYPVSGTSVTDLVSMKKHDHIDFILSQGVGASSTTVTVRASTDAASTTTSAINFGYYLAATSGSDVFAARASAASVTFASGSNQTLVISLNAADLPSGKSFVGINMGSSENLISCVAVLSGARHATDQSPTVLA